MGGIARRTDPELWETVKRGVMQGVKGGKPGQWSARKAQLAVAEYKKRGGGYVGPKSADNHLSEWTREEWGTKSGRRSGETGERYLPREAREKLTDADYQRTTRAKRADTAQGRQFSRQPPDIVRKVAPTRASGKRAAGDGSDRLLVLSRAELLERARRRNISGRSRMRKDELARALQRS